MNKITGMVKTSHINTRIGHILAHIQNQADNFNAADYLAQSELIAIERIKGVRGNSEEMDSVELQPIYESEDMYIVYYPHPGETLDDNIVNWQNAFHMLIRNAATSYTILAARTYELDAGMEYAKFAIELWNIHAELVRGTAVNQLRNQIFETIK